MEGGGGEGRLVYWISPHAIRFCPYCKSKRWCAGAEHSLTVGTCVHLNTQGHYTRLIKPKILMRCESYEPFRLSSIRNTGITFDLKMSLKSIRIMVIRAPSQIRVWLSFLIAERIHAVR